MCCGSTIVNGVIGMAKAVTGIELPEHAEHEKRREICAACPSNVPNPLPVFADVQRLRACKECDCIVGAKIRVASEACPLGKWPAVPASNNSADKEPS